MTMERKVMVSVITALIIFLGGFVLDVNKGMALLSQDIENHKKSQDLQMTVVKQLVTENKVERQKMEETMSNLDKTMSILVDRLKRGELQVHPKR